MILKAEIQRFEHISHAARGRYVGIARSGVAGGMIMRDDYAVCVEIKGTAHDTAQGHRRAGPVAARVEVLGNVESLTGKELHEDTLLPPRAQPADKVFAKIAGARVDGFAQQRFARCRI